MDVRRRRRRVCLQPPGHYDCCCSYCDFLVATVRLSRGESAARLSFLLLPLLAASSVGMSCICFFLVIITMRRSFCSNFAESNRTVCVLPFFDRHLLEFKVLCCWGLPQSSVHSVESMAQLALPVGRLSEALLRQPPHRSEVTLTRDDRFACGGAENRLLSASACRSS